MSMKILDLVRPFGDISGIYIQAYSPEGHIIGPVVSPPSLCAFLAGFPETLNACTLDCLQKAAEGARTGQAASCRCYAGLAYRVSPVSLSGKIRCGLLIGRVLTGIYGEEQMTAAAARYQLNVKEFMQATLKVRQVSEATLDNLCNLLKQTIQPGEIMDRVGEERAAIRSQLKKTLRLINQLLQVPGDGSDPYRPFIEAIRRRFSLIDCALLLPDPGTPSIRVASVVGRNEDTARFIKTNELQKIISANSERWLTVNDPLEMRRLGLETHYECLSLGRLTFDGQLVGYLLCLDRPLKHGNGSHLDLVARLLALQIHHREYRQLWEKRSRELAVLNSMRERLSSADSLDNLLPVGLETAMDSVHAKRGSVLLLAEDGAKVIASAFRGDHAELAGKVRTVDPDSITREVFVSKEPLLVSDVQQEPRPRKKRRYPYASASFVSVPIRNNGGALGVLHLTDPAEEAAFTSWDLLLLDRWSQQLAAAILKVSWRNEMDSLRTMVITDPLTRAYNRQFLDESLQKEIVRAIRFQHPLSVLLIDIDDFKEYNQLLGHDVGDKILRELTNTIRNNVRSIDILGRYGGEEFALILPETGLKGAIGIAEKLRATVEATILPDELVGNERKLTISLGIATFPDMAMDKEELMNKADHALLKAKSIGKNVVISWMG